MCSIKVAKILLVLLNTLFFLVGAACIGVGVLVLMDRSVLTSVLGKIPMSGESLDQTLAATSFLHSSAYIIIAAGAIVFFIACSGCFGAIKESKFMLFVYALTIFVVLGVQVGAAVIGFMYRDQAINYMRNFLNTTIAEKYEGFTIKDGSLANSAEPYSAAWDLAMLSLGCCGNYNYTDFSQYSTKWTGTYGLGQYNLTGAKVPISCCKVTSKTGLLADLPNFANYFTNATKCLMDADPLHTNTINCYDKMIELVSTYTTITFGICVGVAGVEMIGIISACYLLKSIGKDKVHGMKR